MMLDRVGSVRKSECMMGFCVTWKVTMNNVQDVGCEDVRQRGARGRGSRVDGNPRYKCNHHY